MNLYDREIVRGYESIKRRATEACHNGDVSKSIYWVEKASRVANQLNWKYNDEQLNSLMDELSKQLNLPMEESYHAKENRVVFFDQYGKSFILALQYIRALSAAGYDILYILSDYVPANPATFIVDDLKKMPNLTVEVIPLEWSYQQRVRKIYDLTMDFAPIKVFLHVKMFSAYNLVLPALPKEITSYYIDLQDHALWIRNNQLNYVLPYRDWGATIDIEKRGFRPEQVLKMPYYPIVTKAEFQGFPAETEGKVVVFTGGEYYKTVDWDNSYWRLVIQLLLDNPSAVVLYAGKGDTDNRDKAIRELAGGQNLAKRLIPIGFRTDINEVFAHCDIYMGTSPMSGGLMCQYAAFNSKPILQYYRPDMAANNETEQVLDYNGKLNVSFTDSKAFLAEARKLIDSEAYRLARGKELHDCLITKEQFDILLKQTIDSNQTQVVITMQHIDYDAFTRWWFYLEEKGISNCRGYLLSLLKRRKYLVMPMSAMHKWLKT